MANGYAIAENLIESGLAIPPAYTDVWICPRADGHLQATGRDARGRKQYRYHADWRVARDADKFDRMLQFGEALPRIRARVRRDLAVDQDAHLSRDVLLATLVRLLDAPLVRVGNDVYGRTNGSYGLTTLRTKHAAISGSLLKLRFRARAAWCTRWRLTIRRWLAWCAAAKRCQAKSCPVHLRGLRGVVE